MHPLVGLYDIDRRDFPIGAAATFLVASYGKENVLLSPGVRFRRFEGLARGAYFIRKEVEKPEVR
jgi:hypothetical protein